MDYHDHMPTCSALLMDCRGTHQLIQYMIIPTHAGQGSYLMLTQVYMSLFTLSAEKSDDKTGRYAG